MLLTMTIMSIERLRMMMMVERCWVHCSGHSSFSCCSSGFYSIRWIVGSMMMMTGRSLDFEIVVVVGWCCCCWSLMKTENSLFAIVMYLHLVTLIILVVVLCCVVVVVVGECGYIVGKLCKSR